MQNEQPTVAFPLESPATWAKIRKAAEAADTKKVSELLREMKLREEMTSAFIVAVSEERELAAIVKGPDSDNGRGREVQASLEFLANAKPATVVEAMELAAQRVKLVPEQAAIVSRAIDAQQAERYLFWLHGFLSELFGLPLPTAKGHISGHMESPKTAEALRNIGITNLYVIAGWRQTEEALSTAARRRRTYSSFAPKPPDRTRR